MAIQSPERQSRVVGAAMAVSPQTAARLMDTSRSHVYQLIERGVLRANKVPESRCVRIPVEDIRTALGLEGGDPLEAA